MTKESGTRCSNCGQNGHNSRTCNEKLCLKLFGVKICKNKRDDSIKKSFSMGNLQASGGGAEHDDRGYLSDGPVRVKREGHHERKKGIPWTEEEHRTFLAGLEKLGKGDWRGISKQFVTTRTPTQVASHAQKYFLRQSIANKKKRRSSVFDMEIKDQSPKSEAAPSLPMKQNTDILEQSAGPLSPAFASHMAPRVRAPAAPPMPAAWNPNFYGFPYMAGVPNPNLAYPGAFQALPYVQVVNYCNNAGYGFQPQPMNDFAAFKPSASPSPKPMAISASNCIPKVESRGSSTVDTELALSIAPPQVDVNGCIRVI